MDIEANVLNILSNMITKLGNKLDDPAECWVDIYVATNKINGKKYCGMAKCLDYQNKPHGTRGRWKTHVYEASRYGELSTHCWALNRAIAKYGADGFELETIRTVAKKDAGQAEREAIIESNSLVPKGYNITKGGLG